MKHDRINHAKGFDLGCAVCQRNRQVGEELGKVSARHLCDIAGPNKSALSFYSLPNGQPVIVQWFQGDTGIEMYCSLSTSNHLQDTFTSLQKLAQVGTAEPATT